MIRYLQEEAGAALTFFTALIFPVSDTFLTVF